MPSLRHVEGGRKIRSSTASVLVDVRAESRTNVSSKLSHCLHSGVASLDRLVAGPYQRPRDWIPYLDAPSTAHILARSGISVRTLVRFCQFSSFAHHRDIYAGATPGTYLAPIQCKHRGRVGHAAPEMRSAYPEPGNRKPSLQWSLMMCRYLDAAVLRRR